MDKQERAPNLTIRAERLANSQKEVTPRGEKEWAEKVKMEGLSVFW